MLESKGAMVVWSKDAINIFSNSIEKYTLRYVHYIHDGDTESYKKVVDATSWRLHPRKN